MKDERGFTLVEALVALSILAVTMVALYGAIGTSLRGLSRASRYEDAVLVAEARLAELTALRAIPQVLEGTAEDTGFTWRIEPIADAAPERPELAAAPFRHQRLKLTIQWRENGAAKAITVERNLLVWREPR